MCPMRFNRFPLDEHICKFKVGSVNYDDTRMTFSKYVLDYNPGKGVTILDYQVDGRYTLLRSSVNFEPMSGSKLKLASHNNRSRDYPRIKVFDLI